MDWEGGKDGSGTGYGEVEGAEGSRRGSKPMYSTILGSF